VITGEEYQITVGDLNAKFMSHWFKKTEIVIKGQTPITFKNNGFWGAYATKFFRDGQVIARIEYDG
jgi:hypothetical protein